MDERIIAKTVDEEIIYSCTCGEKKLREDHTSKGITSFLCMKCGVEGYISYGESAENLKPYSQEYLAYWEIPF